MIHSIFQNLSYLKNIKIIKDWRDCLLERQRKWDFFGKLGNSDPRKCFRESDL